jgi:hypothetical protein
VIADQSVNYVERLIIDEGHTAQRLAQDYGYDLILFTYDAQGYAESGLAFMAWFKGRKQGEGLSAPWKGCYRKSSAFEPGQLGHGSQAGNGRGNALAERVCQAD